MTALAKQEYTYTISKGDTLWGLANEYTRINKGVSHAEAQKRILNLNPSLTAANMKAGQVIVLPFAKASSMAAKTPRTGYEKWQDTVKQGISDVKWDEHDSIIRSAVAEFNTRLGKKSVYVEKPMPALNWLWIKAIIWVESGGPTNASWGSRPMQIGNPGDPAHGVLKAQAEGSGIIMDKTLTSNINAINTPKINIQAGTAYLLTRLSKSMMKSVLSQTDKKEKSYTVVAGDSLDKISRKCNTTVDVLKQYNPKHVKLIRPGDKLKYYTAKIERVIVGWHSVSAKVIAKQYNSELVDKSYTTKLTYVMDEIFPNLIRNSK